MKFSKHPIGTIINVEGYGKFIKIEKRSFKSLEREAEYFTTRYLKHLQRDLKVDIRIIAAPW